jgi:hypothetical protein
MYLKRCKTNSQRDRFIIAESFYDGACWRSRELMDLGSDPADYIVYPGGNGFFLKDDIEDTLRAKNAAYTDDELERIFLPFLDPRIRRIIKNFDRGGGPSNPWRRMAPDELLVRQQALHDFDKHRLHYLRCGRTHIGNLDAKPWPFLNILLEKSRDEIEHLMEEMEWELPPHEIRAYLYTGLNIQTHFRHLSTRHQPGALDPEAVDRFFLEDLCRLNEDERYFKGVDRRGSDRLHPYLKRYLFLYFDNEFEADYAWRDPAEDFMSRRRFYRPPRKRATLSSKETEACRLLNINLVEFADMDRKALIRCYRRRAMTVHPDKGGDKKAFVRLTEAYECLLRSKP